MLWLAGAVFLLLRWKPGHAIAQKWPKIWFLPFVLLTLGVFALAYAPLPFGWGTLAGLGGYILNWGLGLLSFTGASPALIAGVALFLMLVFGLWDLLKDKEPDAWAKTLVYAIPVLTLIAGGPIAPKILHLTHLVSNVGPQFVSTIS